MVAQVVPRVVVGVEEIGVLVRVAPLLDDLDELADDGDLLLKSGGGLGLERRLDAGAILPHGDLKRRDVQTEVTAPLGISRAGWSRFPATGAEDDRHEDKEQWDGVEAR